MRACFVKNAQFPTESRKKSPAESCFPRALSVGVINGFIVTATPKVLGENAVLWVMVYLRSGCRALGDGVPKVGGCRAWGDGVLKVGGAVVWVAAYFLRLGCAVKKLSSISGAADNRLSSASGAASTPAAAAALRGINTYSCDVGGYKIVSRNGEVKSRVV